jgi:hypothetical protein
MVSNTPSYVIRISHSSQITLLQLGHTPDAYLLLPHMSHSTLLSEMRFLLLAVQTEHTSH